MASHVTQPLPMHTAICNSRRDERVFAVASHITLPLPIHRCIITLSHFRTLMVLHSLRRTGCSHLFSRHFDSVNVTFAASLRLLYSCPLLCQDFATNIAIVLRYFSLGSPTQHPHCSLSIFAASNDLSVRGIAESYVWLLWRCGIIFIMI